MVSILTPLERQIIEQALESAEDILDAHGYFHESNEISQALVILRALAKKELEDYLNGI